MRALTVGELKHQIKNLDNETPIVIDHPDDMYPLYMIIYDANDNRLDLVVEKQTSVQGT